ncbi:MAG: hypothetical protein J5521_05015, partial [Lachnospiraceae bacterium]|nr:hypothetical protein [Lachnospiraceae bacterium]
MQNTNRSNHKRPAGNKKGGSGKKRRVPNYPRIIGWSIGLLLIICVIAIVTRIIIWDKGVKYVMTAEDYERIKLDTLDNVILWPPE